MSSNSGSQNHSYSLAQLSTALQRPIEELRDLVKGGTGIEIEDAEASLEPLTVVHTWLVAFFCANGMGLELSKAILSESKDMIEKVVEKCTPRWEYADAEEVMADATTVLNGRYIQVGGSKKTLDIQTGKREDNISIPMVFTTFVFPLMVRSLFGMLAGRTARETEEDRQAEQASAEDES